MERLWIVSKAPGDQLAMQDAQARGLFLLDPASASAMDEALRAWHARSPSDLLTEEPLGDFPEPVLDLPDDTPDFFGWGAWRFGSRRLVDALALPPLALSTVPVRVRRGPVSDGYQLLMPLRAAHAIDHARSEVDAEEMISAKTGRPFRMIHAIRRLVPPPGFRPPAALFRDEESPGHWLATDALAARVLDAGLTGIWFVHPAWAGEQFGDPVIRGRQTMWRVRWQPDNTAEPMALIPITAEEADAGPPAGG